MFREPTAKWKIQQAVSKMRNFEAMPGSDRDPPKGPKLEQVTQNALGHELRAMYNQIVNEPVPDRFVRLLDQLEQAEERCRGDSEQASKGPRSKPNE